MANGRRLAAWPDFYERIGCPRNILVLAPHPDDETLGCGGLIAAAVEHGVVVKVVFLTNGEASHPNSVTHPPRRLARLRQCEAEAATKRLGSGVQKCFLRLPDTGTASLPYPMRGVVRERLKDEARAFDTELILAPAGNDPHTDHQSAYRWAGELSSDLAIPRLCYHVWSRPQHQANTHCLAFQLGAYRRRKWAALLCHRSQLGLVVKDDPQGFALQPDDLRTMLGPTEEYCFD
ncbi:MAG: PIG-L family deacetylase [Parvularcula sp.]|nr:PIG-L family deacetylase [Parvularcula sp.]